MNKFNNDTYKYLLRNISSASAKEYLKTNPRSKRKIKDVPWPLCNDWYLHKKFSPIKKTCKYLDPTLIEIGDSIWAVTRNECDKWISKNKEKHVFYVNGKPKVPVLMKLNSKVEIAKKIGCSLDTVKNYLRGLVRIGVLRVHNFGDGKIFYSMGYWSRYKIDGQVHYRIIKYMNQDVGNRLIDKFYIRKPSHKKTQKLI